MSASPFDEADESHPDSSVVAESSQPRPCVAYVMSRFPKLTETFVLDEILGLEARGLRVEVFPLWREHEEVLHEEARSVVDRAHFLAVLDFAILRDNLLTLASRPRIYLSALFTLIAANRRSLRFLIGAIAIFPKAVSFSRRMRALGVEHVHAHFASHPAAAAFVVGRLSGLPWSFTAHGSDLHREQSMLVHKVAEARFVVAISDYNRRFILDKVGPAHAESIRVIHCGVEPDRFVRAGSRGKTFEFSCVGTLHAVKGQRVLIEACRGLEDGDLDWRCHFVGEGPDRADLEQRVRELGLGDRFVFHGALDREEVREVLARMDASVAPSIPTQDGRREGIPVVLMEAGASWRPLVASRLSGIPEIVVDDQTGLLVEPGDVAGLTRALLRLAREPRTRERLGGAARLRVEDEFSLVATLDALEAAFRHEGIGR